MVGAIAFVAVASSLLLPGLALRFPVLNSARNVFGAPDSVITALFAASTPVVKEEDRHGAHQTRPFIHPLRARLRFCSRVTC
jgi:hypothetical protein